MSTLTRDTLTPAAERSSEKPKRRRNWEPYIYVAPAFILLMVILIYPLGYSAWLSVHHWTMQTFRDGVPFIGLENYIAAFQDARFWGSLWVTVRFMFFALSLEFVLGLGLALLLDRATWGKRYSRSLILLPMMCTNIVIGLIWRMLLNFDYGVFNYWLTSLGFTGVAWLGNPDTAMLSLIVVDVWNTTCFVALILLAGLQMQPHELREAAVIDGANTLQLFRYVTLPLLRPAIMVALLWRFIDTFRIFDVVFSLTGGGPAQATETISVYIYRTGFQKFDLGYTSALSMLMILLLFVAAFVLYRLIGRVSSLS